MNWRKEKDKGSGSRIEKILEILESNPNGLGFNELCKEMEEYAARNTVKDRLKKLKSLNLVIKEGGERRGQKHIYKKIEKPRELKEVSKRMEQMEDFLEAYKDWLLVSIEKGKIDPVEAIQEIVDLGSKVLNAGSWGYKQIMEGGKDERKKLLRPTRNLIEKTKSSGEKIVEGIKTDPEDIGSELLGKCSQHPGLVMDSLEKDKGEFLERIEESNFLTEEERAELLDRMGV